MTNCKKKRLEKSLFAYYKKERFLKRLES